jgi:hypothetical protein
MSDPMEKRVLIDTLEKLLESLRRAEEVQSIATGIWADIYPTGADADNWATFGWTGWKGATLTFKWREPKTP